ncbi:MAG: hypothetical protein IBX57_00840 [Gammaproteobacteria bacterium]|nr:hypothetical protein [Gammaproteobacteria bacterium]
MSKIAFQGLVFLDSALPGAEAGTWEAKIYFQDSEGVVNPYAIKVGDYVVFDTASTEAGTMGFYEIESIIQSDWQTPTVLLRELPYNSYLYGAPNLQWAYQLNGIIARPSEKHKLIPVVAPDAQNTSDRLSTYLQNFNFVKMIDAMETGGDPINGGVFITDVTPVLETDNVGGKVYTDNDITLLECSSTSLNVIVKVVALTGHKNYKPLVTVNDLPVTLAPKEDAPLFEGTIELTLTETGSITALHEDGAVWYTSVIQDIPPSIVKTEFSSPYPVGQTELKQGDTVSITYEVDKDVVAYEIDDFGALEASSGSLTLGMTGTIEGLVIADRGTATQDLGFRLRVQKENGAWSNWFDSDSTGFVDGINTVKLNDLYPTITVTGYTYPLAQSAIKVSETATVEHSIENFDSVEYISSELSIVNPTLYEISKVVSDPAVDYSYQTNNLTIVATRAANGAVTTKYGKVNIASVAPSINISTPFARLRSGGNNGTQVQTYTITLSSDQYLEEEPILNIPEGTWVDASWTPNAARTIWTRRIIIHDDNAKGTYAFNSLNVINGAGIFQSLISSGENYTIGGFVFRTLRVDAFPNRMTAIGTEVVNTAKLRCTNLSKGTSGSLNYTFRADTLEATNQYTIVDSLGNYQSTGIHWYNNDGNNASSNTGGEMYIELEEVV